MFSLCFEDRPSPFAQLLATKHADSVLIHCDGFAHGVAEAGFRFHVLDSLGESVQVVRLGEVLAGLLQVV